LRPAATGRQSLPGIAVTTNPANYDVFRSAQLERCEGTGWVLIGNLISD
jgi:hypothetical protein